MGREDLSRSRPEVDHDLRGRHVKSLRRALTVAHDNTTTHFNHITRRGVVQVSKVVDDKAA